MGIFRLERDGTFSVFGTFKTVVAGLDQPTSLELVGQVGFVVTVTGTILRVGGL